MMWRSREDVTEFRTAYTSSSFRPKLKSHQLFGMAMIITNPFVEFSPPDSHLLAQTRQQVSLVRRLFRKC